MENVARGIVQDRRAAHVRRWPTADDGHGLTYALVKDDIKTIVLSLLRAFVV
ncbi:MAG: hypothetical protein FJY85_01235 [Deltaproteobacteria bacterium]|nr:hypothetical protein [Deltaproteobacteria bacterium]